MVVWKRIALVSIALVVSLGITVLVAVDVPDNDSNTPIKTEQDMNRTPAPITNASVSGAPPENVYAFPRFISVAHTVGFNYESTYRGRGLISQSGVYVADYNNDGYEDVLAVGGAKPVLFENSGSGFRRAQTFDHPDTRTAHFFDYDNDGWQDLVLAEYAGNIIFYQNNNGSFERHPVGLDQSVRSPTAVTAADFTGNGCLDLFVAQNGLWQQGAPLPLQETLEVYDKHPTVRPTTTPGGRNLLFYNDCRHFQPATDHSGIRGRNWTLAASAADFTGDGYIDIHVGNDFSADFLYINTGNGTFRRRDLGPQTDRNAMGSVAKDMTGDGRTDLFVTNIYTTQNTETTNQDDIRTASAVPHGNNFLINTGHNGSDLFVDQAEAHGVQKGGWGWAVSVDDFNNDGHLDIIHGTSGEIAFEPYDRFRTPQVWRGTPGSWEAVDERSLGLAEHQARGMARLDYNNDGAIDFALATTAASSLETGGYSTPFALYKNKLSDRKSSQSLQILLRNYDGVSRNAVVLVKTEQRTIQRTANARSGFLSQDSRLIHIGTGNEELKEIRVRWPDGTESVYGNLTEGGRYILTPSGSDIIK